MATPMHRKNVRFDAMESSEVSINSSPGEERAMNGILKPSVFQDSQDVSTASTAPLSPGRSSRKTPSIRMVDAFGREHSPLDDASIDNQSKSTVRVVDAMGRDVDEVSPAATEPDRPIPHAEAISMLKKGVSDLHEFGNGIPDDSE